MTRGSVARSVGVWLVLLTMKSNIGLTGLASLLCVPAMALAGYSGATAKVFDIQPGDVPGPEPIRVFPVPAAAGWSGSKIMYA